MPRKKTEKIQMHEYFENLHRGRTTLLPRKTSKVMSDNTSFNTSSVHLLRSRSMLRFLETYDSSLRYFCIEFAVISLPRKI